jgi:hypothetical protein
MMMLVRRFLYPIIIVERLFVGVSGSSSEGEGKAPNSSSSGSSDGASAARLLGKASTPTTANIPNNGPFPFCSLLFSSLFSSHHPPSLHLSFSLNI